MDEKDAPAEMPGEEEIARLVSPLDWEVADTTEVGSEMRNIFPVEQSLSKARAVLALFAPILAEKEAQIKELDERATGYWQTIEKDVFMGSSREKTLESRALAAEAALAAKDQQLQIALAALKKIDEGSAAAIRAGE